MNKELYQGEVFLRTVVKCCDDYYTFRKDKYYRAVETSFDYGIEEYYSKEYNQTAICKINKEIFDKHFIKIENVIIPNHLKIKYKKIIDFLYSWEISIDLYPILLDDNTKIEYYYIIGVKDKYIGQLGPVKFNEKHYNRYSEATCYQSDNTFNCLSEAFLCGLKDARKLYYKKMKGLLGENFSIGKCFFCHDLTNKNYIEVIDKDVLYCCI